MQHWVCRSVSSKAGLTVSICLVPCACTLISSDRFCRVTGFSLTWALSLSWHIAYLYECWYWCLGGYGSAWLNTEREQDLVQTKLAQSTARGPALKDLKVAQAKLAQISARAYFKKTWSKVRVYGKKWAEKWGAQQEERAVSVNLSWLFFFFFLVE